MAHLVTALDAPMPQLIPMLNNLVQNCLWFKIDPAFLMNSEAVSVIHDLTGAQCKLFFDLKLYGTAESIARAADRAARLGAHIISVFHSVPMIQAAKGREMAVVACGPLSDKDYGITNPQMNRFAIYAADGLICPPLSGPLSRSFERWPDKLRIVPGIRPEGFGNDGHASTLTPALAAALGGTHIVIGRPIYEDNDPARMADSMKGAIKRGEAVLAKALNPE